MDWDDESIPPEVTHEQVGRDYAEKSPPVKRHKWADHEMRVLFDSDKFFSLQWDPHVVPRQTVVGKARRRGNFSVRRLFQYQTEKEGRTYNVSSWKRKEVV